MDSSRRSTNCNKIPSNLINSVGQGLLEIYPTPNANAGNREASYNYVNEPVRR